MTRLPCPTKGPASRKAVWLDYSGPRLSEPVYILNLRFGMGRGRIPGCRGYFAGHTAQAWRLLDGIEEGIDTDRNHRSTDYLLQGYVLAVLVTRI